MTKGNLDIDNRSDDESRCGDASIDVYIDDRTRADSF